MDELMNEIFKVAVPHNGCRVDNLLFIDTTTLASSSMMDQRINFWTVA